MLDLREMNVILKDSNCLYSRDGKKSHLRIFIFMYNKNVIKRKSFDKLIWVVINAVSNVGGNLDLIGNC